MSRSAGFQCRVRVKFSDLDSFGHVNHARYLTYCEDSRTEWLRLLQEETGSRLLETGFSIVHVDCDYHASITLAAIDVRVRCQVLELGRSSLRLRYDIETDTAIAAVINATMVMTARGAARPMTRVERAFFAQYLPQSETGTKSGAIA
ncbi:MAG: acyl-CoA thioesterase [Solirubrobacteraceae bacterium]